MGIGSRTNIKILDTDSCQTFIAGGESTNNKVCKPATTLHTKTCNRTSGGCAALIGNGNTITYGTLVSGSPKAGDAYDCDVNNDGIYDAQTERFYYVTSSGANSILMYYSNMNGQTTYAYADYVDVRAAGGTCDRSVGCNWYGPVTAYKHLPSTDTWSNPKLITSETRQIVSENGSTSTNGGTIRPFTYTGKAARLITAQELFNACSSALEGSCPLEYRNGELDGCTWILENIGYYEANSGCSGYWLETPRYEDTCGVWYLGCSVRCTYGTPAGNAESRGVRPVITVPTSSISN